MYRTLIVKTGIPCAMVGLLWLSAGCSDGRCEGLRDKVYVDKYETVKCTNCPKTKYVYNKAPRLPEKVVRVHRVKQPCPPQRIVHVQLPPEKRKVRYEYINEGTCKESCRKPCCY